MSVSGYWLIGEIDDAAARSLAPSFERWRMHVEADSGFRRCRSTWDATADVLAHVTSNGSDDNSWLEVDGAFRAIEDLFSNYQPSNDLFMECADLVASDEIWDLRSPPSAGATATALIGTRKLAPISLVFVALGPVASRAIPGCWGTSPRPAHRSPNMPMPSARRWVPTWSSCCTGPRSGRGPPGTSPSSIQRTCSWCSR